MEILRSIDNYFKTVEELIDAGVLIRENKGNVNMVAYDSSSDNLLGKQFGPMGYDESEMDAVRRELKENKRINVSRVMRLGE